MRPQSTLEAPYLRVGPDISGQQAVVALLRLDRNDLGTGVLVGEENGGKADVGAPVNDLRRCSARGWKCDIVLPFEEYLFDREPVDRPGSDHDRMPDARQPQGSGTPYPH